MEATYSISFNALIAKNCVLRQTTVFHSSLRGLSFPALLTVCYIYNENHWENNHRNHRYITWSKIRTE